MSAEGHIVQISVSPGGVPKRSVEAARVTTLGVVMTALITGGGTPPVNPAPFRLGRFASRTPTGTFVSSSLG